MLSLIISTVVFAVAYFFLHRFLDNWGLEKGGGRTLLVLTIASLLSYGAMSVVGNFTHEPSLIDNLLKVESPGVPLDSLDH